MSSELASLEADVREYTLQLETVQSSLQAEPDNEELSALQDELNELITLAQQSIADLQPSQRPTPVAPPASNATASGSVSGRPTTKTSEASVADTTETTQQKTKPDSQTTAKAQVPQQRPSAAPPHAQIPTYAVNDNVLARWVSGDNAFYPSRILSITGSATNPIYVVVFKSYGNRESVTAKDIKPITNNNINNIDNSSTSNIPGSQKRKADAVVPGSSSVSSATTPATTQNSPSVISAAANINPALADQQRQDKKNLNDQEGSGNRRPAKTRKVKANKELEVGKTKWQEFASKGKLGKGFKKESMFRTGEGPNSRVGFIGSGQKMRKDPTRTKHIYQHRDDDY